MNRPNHTSDLNLIWDVGGKEPYFIERDTSTSMGLSEWQRLGHDRHSVFEDPKLADIANRDFAVQDGSPAEEIGWEPIDLSDVGPQPH